MSIGVVALTASRFGWRRTKTGPEQPSASGQETALPAEPSPDDATAPECRPRFQPAVRWDASPEEYAAATRPSGDPPAP